MNNRICLFALYDPRALSTGTHAIAPDVVHYLRQIAASGFCIHLALSGMTHVFEQDRELFSTLGIVAHPRPNIGHDFGAWQALIDRGCIDGAETILLANDSVFGPLRPLPPIVDTMLSRDLDVWGMVESREARWHLQSWFLCFSAASFASPAIRRCMRQPFDRMGRDEIVLHGELGLGAAIEADGLRWDARWRQPSRRLRRLVPGNAMHLDFMSVVRSGAVPFLKAELLRANPTRIGWVDRWRTLVDRSGFLSSDAIDAALAIDGRSAAVAARARQAMAMRLLYATISSDRPEAAMSLLGR